jgi:predicted anti-sigma-YlaC factor YlaD
MKKLFKSTAIKCLCMLLFCCYYQQTNAQLINSGYESGTLTGWAGTSVVTASPGFTVLQWTVNPAGTRMAKIMPTPNLLKATAETNLGLSPGSLTTFNSGLFNTSTNYGTMTQSVSLNAG